MSEDTGEMTQPQIPTAENVKTILHDALGKDAQYINRFSTGHINYVYEVTTSDGEKLVVRLTRPESQQYFQGAMHWYELLKAKGVPLPTIHYSDIESSSHPFPTMIMDRLPGKDLVDVYPSLTQDQKRDLAKRMVSIQRSVATLPEGKGFGYASSEDDPSLKTSWIDVLEASLERSLMRIKQAKIVNEDITDRVTQAVHDNAEYFLTIKPVCFLDDTTTKNVMIDNGKLSGIVDVDSVAYGDPLLTVALTRMSLLARGYETDYIDYWLEELHITSQQRKALDIYTAIFCIEFLSEMGQQFNKEKADDVDREEIKKLENILEALLD